MIAVFERSGVLDDAIKDWHKLTPTNRTWANAQVHFKRANKERKRQATSKEAGYAAANAASRAPATTPAPNQGTPTTGTTMHYCWSHGLGFNPNHTSATCTNRAQGHVETATVENMQGGNNKIRCKRTEQAIYRPPNGPNTNQN